MGQKQTLRSVFILQRKGQMAPRKLEVAFAGEGSGTSKRGEKDSRPAVCFLPWERPAKISRSGVSPGVRLGHSKRQNTRPLDPGHCYSLAKTSRD